MKMSNEMTTMFFTNGLVNQKIVVGLKHKMHLMKENLNSLSQVKIMN